MDAKDLLHLRYGCFRLAIPFGLLQAVDHVVERLVRVVAEQIIVAAFQANQRGAMTSICIEETYDIRASGAAFGASCALQPHDLFQRLLVSNEATKPS